MLQIFYEAGKCNSIVKSKHPLLSVFEARSFDCKNPHTNTYKGWVGIVRIHQDLTQKTRTGTYSTSWRLVRTRVRELLEPRSLYLLGFICFP